MNTFAGPAQLRSNWKTPVGRGKIPKRGVSRPVSRLEMATGRVLSFSKDDEAFMAEREAKKAAKKIRVAHVRRRSGGFRVTGLEDFFAGKFADLKKNLRELGFTGVKMGAISCSV